MTGAFTCLTVAVDGSPASIAGVQAALRYAAGARVVFCSVVDLAAPFPLVDIPLPPPPPSADDLRAQARAVCEEALHNARSRGVRAESTVVEDRPAAGILSCARAHGSDAIAIGSHGRTGLARILLGSVAEEVIRRSAVPVIVGHPGDDERVGPIAVAIDGSAAADAALSTALALAKASGHALCLFHAFNRADLKRIDALGQDDAERAAEAHLQAQAMLDEAAEHSRAEGVACESFLLEGNPAPELLAAFERHRCSSVVVGTHGHSEVGRVVFGSVAAEIVERARIPVFVVRKAA